MSDLPILKQLSENEVVQVKYELEAKQTEALTSLAKAVTDISTFISGGGLNKLLSGVARGNAVSSMLGGLTTHAGRNGLDARTLKQNAVEVVEQIEAVFSKFEERLAAKNKGEQRDPELKDPPTDENTYTEWVKKQREKEKNE